MAEYIPREEFDKLLLSKIEPWELVELQWNSIQENLKSESSSRFKKLLQESILYKYWLVFWWTNWLCAQPLFI